MLNAFKNLLSFGGSNSNGNSSNKGSRKQSNNSQGNPSDDNIRYEVINFEIQENENMPRVKQFIGKVEEEEIENQSPQLLKKRSQSMNVNSSSITRNSEQFKSIGANPSDQKQEDDESKYIFYTTTNQDTLIGLSIKFNISEQKIKLINDVSDTVFPGMKLKFPKELCQSQSTEDSTIDDTYQMNRRKALSLKKEPQASLQSRMDSNQEIHRFHFYYCTPYGNIMGCLSINDSVIMFDPSLSNATNMQKLQKKRVIKFQACIDIKDINESTALVLPPRASEITNENAKEYVLQISLSHIGNKDIYKKYKDRLKQLKKEKKSISTVYFRVFEKDHLGNDLSNQDKQQIVQQVVEIINKNIENYQKKKQEQKLEADLQKSNNNSDQTSSSEEKHFNRSQSNPIISKANSDFESMLLNDTKTQDTNMTQSLTHEKSKEKEDKSQEKEEQKEGSDEEFEQESLTILPFFDILYENIVQKKKLTTQEAEQNQMNQWLTLEFGAKMLEHSNVLTQELFLQIIYYVPSMFRYTNWRLLYSNMKHGMSFQTLYRHCEEESPIFLVVQTFQGEKFGAYLSDPLHITHAFYGNGECFLFKFQGEEQKIKAFQPTGKNQHFIFSNSDGLGVGCGEKYGLFINCDLYRGQTNKCDTFDNEILSSDGKEQFKIKNIEIWGIDM
ncbi:TLD protein (macronuclear) [Tetrahymena thermophila SB210]|uniref:Oxidation resistance protein 1 n=1 Tax=Tetrahymena thermophila (strain SB210) TaxID=312017 RepID=I7LWD1_TETTS|nr:TLD protein [Tetrahymena thermophila SB210]EAS01406.2 TLD protein [Tetrahymena thermophila SB210]|eukprot:XP_001021652.2 TLD protein [Tetrahymena thermophila SB210]